ncbi:tRNA 2'-phosphotransferase [Cryptotrichosporon argae]
MGRPNDSPDVKASKALAYILRHGAEKEGLQMRSDGFLKLTDVLARPRLKDVDEPTVLRLVKENAKQRFELVWAYDPSSPRPKKKRVNQPKKQKPAPGNPGPASETAPASAPTANGADAAQLDDARAALATAAPAPESEHVDLPLVLLTPPDEAGASTSEPRGEWYIRASQGHSLAVDTAAHLEPVGDDEDGRRRAGLAVHGTRWELWDTLREQGLSRMSRQHVHLAPSLVGSIVPRPHSTLLIYLSPALLAAHSPPIPLYTSRNGVVLTPGDAGGRVPASCWAKAVHVAKGKRTVIWEDGRAVERDEMADEVERERVVSEQSRVDAPEPPPA